MGALVIAPLAHASAGAPVWAVAVAGVVVALALYLLLGAHRLPFMRSERHEDATPPAPEDPARQPPPAA